MRRRARLLPVLAAVAILAATVVARFATTNAHADVLAVLQGNVGPDFAISLKNPDGSVVSHLDAGPYEIQVADQATNHNYHLEGPGVSMATGIPDVQSADWMVTLGDGLYTYHCDQHLSLSANFAVGSASLPPPPAPVSIVTAPAPLPTPLPSTSSSPSSKNTVTPAIGSVGGNVRAALAGTKLTLTLNGKPLTKVAAGTYRVVVVDTSKTLGLTLAHVGAPQQQLTTTLFSGTKTVTVVLAAGRWTVYSANGVSRPFTVTK